MILQLMYMRFFWNASRFKLPLTVIYKNAAEFLEWSYRTQHSYKGSLLNCLCGHIRYGSVVTFDDTVYYCYLVVPFWWPVRVDFLYIFATRLTFNTGWRDYQLSFAKIHVHTKNTPAMAQDITFTTLQVWWRKWLFARLIEYKLNRYSLPKKRRGIGHILVCSGISNHKVDR